MLGCRGGQGTTSGSLHPYSTARATIELGRNGCRLVETRFLNIERISTSIIITLYKLFMEQKSKHVAKHLCFVAYFVRQKALHLKSFCTTYESIN